MNTHLEDTLGDIVRKARISTQTDLACAAAVAGLSEPDYDRFEETGQAPRDMLWEPLGELLTLDGSKLAHQAAGWLPKPVDLSQWKWLKRFVSSGSGMEVNCYLIWDEATREAALFDTGFDANPILAHINELGLQLRHLFITHTHHDHIAAMQPIRERHAELQLHSSSPNAPSSQRNRPDDSTVLGGLQITHRPTQGHADDGVTYLVNNWPGNRPAVALVGDAVFAGSIGGAKDKLELARTHIREHILSLPPETLICPGHGPVTTVAEETEWNPWF